MITNLSDYKSALNKSQKLPFIRSFGLATPGSWRFSYIDDMFSSQVSQSEGYPPIRTTNPLTSSLGSGELLNSNSIGAFKFKPPASGNNLYLNSVFASISRNSVTSGGDLMPNQGNGTIHVWDRLWTAFCSIINTGTPVNNNFTQPNLTRYTDGEGLSLWYALSDNYSTIAAVTIQVSYVNQNGVSKQSNFTFNVTNTTAGTDIMMQYNVFPIPLGPGDSGIRKLTGFRVISGGITTPIGGSPGYIFIAKYYGAYPIQNLTEYPTHTNFLNGNNFVHNEAFLCLAGHLSGYRWQFQNQSVDNRPFVSGELILVEG